MSTHPEIFLTKELIFTRKKVRILLSVKSNDLDVGRIDRFERATLLHFPPHLPSSAKMSNTLVCIYHTRYLCSLSLSLSFSVCACVSLFPDEKSWPLYRPVIVAALTEKYIKFSIPKRLLRDTMLCVTRGAQIRLNVLFFCLYSSHSHNLVPLSLSLSLSLSLWLSLCGNAMDKVKAVGLLTLSSLPLLCPSFIRTEKTTSILSTLSVSLSLSSSPGTCKCTNNYTLLPRRQKLLLYRRCPFASR